jgi:hypothetical protein
MRVMDLQKPSPSERGPPAAPRRARAAARAARAARAAAAAPFLAALLALAAWLAWAGPAYYRDEWWWRPWPAPVHLACRAALLGDCPTNAALAVALGEYWLAPAAAALAAAARLAARAAPGARGRPPPLARSARAAAAWAARLVPRAGWARRRGGAAAGKG